MSRATWAVLAVCLCGLGISGCGGDGGKKFEGSGPSVTLPFEVSDNWQLEYEFTGQFLRITILDEFGGRAGTASQQGAGIGVSRFPTGGSYSLEIQTETTGTWTINIISQAP